MLSTVTAEDTVDTGDYAEVAYEVVQGQHVLSITPYNCVIHCGYAPVLSCCQVMKGTSS